MKNFILGLLSGTVITSVLATIGFSSMCNDDPENTVNFFANLL